MLGLVLLYVGAVLFINGLTMLNKIAPREAAIMNIFTGVVAFLVSFKNGFSGDAALLQSCAYGLLFAFTYLWVAYNYMTAQDGRGLGWFSFFVAVTAAAITFDQLSAGPASFGDKWLVFCWASWSILWAAFFVIGALGKTNLVRPVAFLTLFVAITSAWLPGYLFLSGHMPQ